MKLAEMRKARGFSVRKLAKAAGVSPTTIYYIESGTYGAGFEPIGKISHALNVDPLEIDEFATALDKAGMGKAVA